MNFMTEDNGFLGDFTRVDSEVLEVEGNIDEFLRVHHYIILIFYPIKCVAKFW